MKKHAKLSTNQLQELNDLIRQNKDALELRRAQAILMLNEESKTSIITMITGFKTSAIFAFRNRFAAKGFAGIENKRKKTFKSLLTKSQREQVITWLTETQPFDHEYDSQFWTTLILGDLIEKEFNVKYKSRKPLYLLFHEAKLSFHKPGKVYELRDPIKVEKWQQETAVILQDYINDQNCVILCEDEMILSTQTTSQKVWISVGKYPEIKISKTKKNKSIYGFLNIKTGQAHAFAKDWQNMHITVDVLREVQNIYPDKKLLILWDSAGWHRGSAVQEFINNNPNVTTLYFPAYAPDQNPQEHIWKEARSKTTHNKFIPDLEIAAANFCSYINQTIFNYKLLDLFPR